MDKATLFVEEALATEELQEWLSVSSIHTGSDGLYNPLLLGAIHDSETLTASEIDFAPGVWLNPLLDSGSGFGVVISESAFAAAGVGCNEF